MFLLPLLGLSMLLFLALGGRLSGFVRVRLKWIPFVLLAAVNTNLVFSTGLYYSNPLVGKGLWASGFILAIAFFWRNRGYRALVVAGLGGLSNLAVIVANNGVMPTGKLAYAAYDRAPDWWRQPGLEGVPPHAWAIPGDTPLWFMSDVFPPFLPLSSYPSIGDLVLGIGVIWFVGAVMFGSYQTAEERQAEIAASLARLPQEPSAVAIGIAARAGCEALHAVPLEQPVALPQFIEAVELEAPVLEAVEVEAPALVTEPPAASIPASEPEQPAVTHAVAHQALIELAEPRVVVASHDADGDLSEWCTFVRSIMSQTHESRDPRIVFSVVDSLFDVVEARLELALVTLEQDYPSSAPSRRLARAA